MRMTRVRGGGNAQGKGRHVRVDLSRTAGRGHREASGPRAPGSQGWGWQTLPLEQFPERASSLGLDHHVNSQPKDSFYPPVIKNQLGSPARGWESGPSGTGPAAPGCVRPRCLHARGRADTGTRASGLGEPAPALPFPDRVPSPHSPRKGWGPAGRTGADTHWILWTWEQKSNISTALSKA